MKDNKEHIYQVGSKELRINETSISWRNGFRNKTIQDPTEIRCGTAPIEVDMFTIGTKYKIDLRNGDGSTFTISIKSYFGIGKNQKFNLYEEISDLIWNNFFAERFGLMVSEWEEGQTQRVGNFEIDSVGLTRKGSPRITMRFDEMELLPRFDHMLINSKSSLDKYMRVYFLKEWNWPLVLEILYRAKDACISKATE